MVTLGFYPAIWYLRRQAFLDGLRSPTKLGVALPIVILATGALGTAISIAQPKGALEGLTSLLSLASGLTSLLTAFRVASILRSEIARAGAPVRVSGIMTFFFGILYLQAKMNEIAELAEAGVWRRQKRKGPPAESPSDLADDAPARGADTP